MSEYIYYIIHVYVRGYLYTMNMRGLCVYMRCKHTTYNINLILLLCTNILQL